MAFDRTAKAVTAAMMTRKIRAQIARYSMAVAPPSSRWNGQMKPFTPGPPLSSARQSRSRSQAISGSSAGGMG